MLLDRCPLILEHSEVILLACNRNLCVVLLLAGQVGSDISCCVLLLSSGQTPPDYFVVVHVGIKAVSLILRDILDQPVFLYHNHQLFSLLLLRFLDLARLPLIGLERFGVLSSTIGRWLLPWCLTRVSTTFPRLLLRFSSLGAFARRL